MKIHKYHGAGNDFIITDEAEAGTLTLEQIKLLCDRKYGIGGDGLISFSRNSSRDFSMKYFNSDGSTGMMCGNGGRCIVSFAASAGIIPGGTDGTYIFDAPDGVHTAKILSREGRKAVIRLKMNDVPAATRYAEGFYLETGCPHLIVEMESDIETLDILAEGRKLRFDPRFSPGGTNVDWTQRCGDVLRIRTYERGIEGETMACGTGVVASALAHYLVHGEESPVFRKADGLLCCTLKTNDSIMKVEFRPERDGILNFKDVHLTGETVSVFTAEI